MPLPISIVIPHMKSRSWFFRRFALPTMRMNDPEAVIIEDWEGGACAKRNAGAAKATSPYIIFVDDDTLLAEDCLRKMLAALEETPSAGFAYSGYTGIVLPGVRFQTGENYVMKSQPYDLAKLRKSNFIDTTSLLRRSLFPGFDTNLERLQDWDLWLTLAGRGIHGTFIDDRLFMKFHVDEGISTRVSLAKPAAILKRKHRLS